MKFLEDTLEAYKQFICPICDDLSYNQSQLDNHILIYHSPQRSNSADGGGGITQRQVNNPICEELSPQRQLDSPASSHSSDRFTCNMHPYFHFYTQKQFNLHMEQYHSSKSYEQQDLSSTSPTNRMYSQHQLYFKCQVCGNISYTQSQLDCHLATYHHMTPTLTAID